MILAFLCCLLLIMTGCNGSGEADLPNIVLITVDTLRADHLGCYGYERPTSPRIDQLAGEGVRFKRAYAQAPWTLPSVATIHTSAYPSRHGAQEVDCRLPDDLPVLAEVLQARGYRTLGVISHLFVSRKYGFQRGFDHFDESQKLGYKYISSPQLTEKALELAGAAGDQPIFLWIHYFDPHSTFFYHAKHDFIESYEGPLPRDVVLLDIQSEPEALSEADLQYVRDLYDGEIAFTDRWIGKLVRDIKAGAGGKKTLVFLTADHGEEFKDHGQIGHGKYCYNELLHVPLILAGDLPDALRGKVVEGNTEIRGLARTIAEACGIADHPFKGGNLFEAAAREADPNPSIAREAGPNLGITGEALCISEGSYAWGDEQHRWSLIFRDWKLLAPLKGKASELYRLPEDPAEQTNLWTSETKEAQAARAFLEAKLTEIKGGTARTGHTMDMEESDLEHLRAMGYVR